MNPWDEQANLVMQFLQAAQGTPQGAVFSDPLFLDMLANAEQTAPDQLALLVALWQRPETRSEAVRLTQEGHSLESVKAYTLNMGLQLISQSDQMNGYASPLGQTLAALTGSQAPPWYPPQAQTWVQQYTSQNPPPPGGDPPNQGDPPAGGAPPPPDPSVRPNQNYDQQRAAIVAAEQERLGLPSTNQAPPTGGPSRDFSGLPAGTTKPAGAEAWRMGDNGVVEFRMRGQGGAYWVPAAQPAPTAGGSGPTPTAPPPVTPDTYDPVGGYGTRPTPGPSTPSRPPTMGGRPTPTGPGPRPPAPGTRPTIGGREETVPQGPPVIPQDQESSFSSPFQAKAAGKKPGGGYSPNAQQRRAGLEKKKIQIGGGSKSGFAGSF